MAVELDVIVDVDTGTDLPLAVDERLRRQRAERGLIQPFEKVAAAGPVEAHRLRIELGKELGDPRVEGGEGEEGLVAEAGEDPPLRDLHGDFDLRLVPGLRRPRREDDRTVVLREFVVGPVGGPKGAATDPRTSSRAGTQNDWPPTSEPYATSCRLSSPSPSARSR